MNYFAGHHGLAAAAIAVNGQLTEEWPSSTWRARQLMRRWMRETGLDGAASASALDDLTPDDV